VSIKKLTEMGSKSFAITAVGGSARFRNSANGGGAVGNSRRTAADPFQGNGIKILQRKGESGKLNSRTVREKSSRVNG